MQIFAIILLLLGLSIQSLASQEIHEIPKYFLKSLADPYEGIYSQLKISLEVDESAFQNTQSDKAVKEVVDIVIGILSDLVLSQPLNAVPKFGEKIQCDDFLIHEIIKSQGIDADFGLYITISNKSQNELTTIKKCESGNQLLAVSIAINLEKFVKLETVSQVKLLSSALAGIIFEDDLIRNQLLSEIEDYLKNWMGTNCNIPNCTFCSSEHSCTSCEKNLYPNYNSTQCCPSLFCVSCPSGNQCDTCWAGYYFNNNKCMPCNFIYCSQCNSTSCIECLPGYYLNSNNDCYGCSRNCAVCKSIGDGENSVCTECYDPDHSQVLNGLCTCLKPNEIYNQNNICACAPGFYQDSNGNCQACGHGCQTCTSPSQCSACFDSYDMTSNGDGTCSCTNNELKFNTTTNICACPYRQYLNTTTNSCEPCQDTCAACSSLDGHCYECVNNNILHTIGGSNCVCNDDTKVYDNKTESCVSCPDGNYAYGGVCYPCLDGCATCIEPGKCTTCPPGMHMSIYYGCICDEVYTLYDTSSNSCVSCTSVTPNCEDNCILGCKACSDYQSCLTCYDSLENINGECVCKDHKQEFSNMEKKCVGESSAQGLASVWILVLYAAI